MKWMLSLAIVFLPFSLALPASAQTPPSATDVGSYKGLHKAAWDGDVAEIDRLLKKGSDPNARDGFGRTPLHVAAFRSHDAAISSLVNGGGDPNLLENGRYDIITIAAVANDPGLISLAVKLGGNPGNITSIYDGTALIAAAHLGHVEVVEVLIKAGAPLDHINNLGWTALLEAVILGDGGPRHVRTASALIKAGADRSIADRAGRTPLDHAKARGYEQMIAILQKSD